VPSGPGYTGAFASGLFRRPGAGKEPVAVEGVLGAPDGLLATGLGQAK
jgi:hypothetical protein